MATASLSSVDLATIVAYFVLLFAIAFVTSRRGGSAQTGASYFLAEKRVNFLAAGCSLFASNIGSEHFIGLAGSGCSYGVSVGWFEWGSIPCILLLGYVFLPVYLNAGTRPADAQACARPSSDNTTHTNRKLRRPARTH
jgi:Na+/proline symporter